MSKWSDLVFTVSKFLRNLTTPANSEGNLYLKWTNYTIIETNDQKNTHTKRFEKDLSTIRIISSWYLPSYYFHKFHTMDQLQDNGIKIPFHLYWNCFSFFFEKNIDKNKKRKFFNIDSTLSQNFATTIFFLLPPLSKRLTWILDICEWIQRYQDYFECWSSNL